MFILCYDFFFKKELLNDQNKTNKEGAKLITGYKKWQYENEKKSCFIKRKTKPIVVFVHLSFQFLDTFNFQQPYSFFELREFNSFLQHTHNS